MTCSIWSGYQPGIYIGSSNRKEHFSHDNSSIIIEIEGEECLTELPPSFWRHCPEIRVARNKSGFNVLLNWIRKYELLPPGESIKKKGRKDAVTLEVVKPFRRFRLSL